MALEPEEFVLSPVNPDYDDILDQFHLALAQKPSWNNIITSGTGETILRLIASVGSFSQNAIERAQQESQSLDTARLASSVYRITRMLGVHIIRRRPASVNVTLTRTDTDAFGLPAYSNFAINGVNFFNREPISFIEDQITQTVVLYGGSVASETAVSNGTSYQQFAIGNKDFSISDDDLYAELNGYTWRKVTNGLWRYLSTDRIFHENSQPDGRVRVMFGNGIYGALPPAGIVTFRYVIVDTSLTNLQIPIGTQVLSIDNSIVSGVTASVPTDFEDYKDPSFYKIMAPAISAAKGRAVTRKDHRALVSEYPTVIDNVFLGQAEVNPSDVRFMNIVSACLLTTRPWTQHDWTRFLIWYQNIGMACLEFIKTDPEEVRVNWLINVYCFNRANLENIRNSVNSFITDYFRPKLGSLGAEYRLDDISCALKDTFVDKTGKLIDYVDIVFPESFVKLRRTQYMTIETLEVNAYYSQRNNESVVTTLGSW